MDAPECCICYEGVNDSTRRPRVLPCGHSICTMCINNSIERGNRTCPSCRQPHHVADSSKLPINFALEEVFQKLSMKTSLPPSINTEIMDDVRQKKENIIRETRYFKYSFETSVLDLQNELSMKESLIANNQSKVYQKKTEMASLKRDIECLDKDIQEDKNAKQGLEGSITELEGKIRFLENSVQNIRSSKTSSEVGKLDEDIKRKLKLSRIQLGNAKQKDSTPNEDHLQPRIVQLVKKDGLMGIRWMGGSEYNLPIYIREIYPDTAAHCHGGLKPGDCLLSVNGISMEDQKLMEAVNHLKSIATREVTLQVRYTPGALEETRKVYKVFGLDHNF